MFKLKQNKKKLIQNSQYLEMQESNNDNIFIQDNDVSKSLQTNILNHEIPINLNFNDKNEVINELKTKGNKKKSKNRLITSKSDTLTYINLENTQNQGIIKQKGYKFSEYLINNYNKKLKLPSKTPTEKLQILLQLNKKNEIIEIIKNIEKRNDKIKKIKNKKNYLIQGYSIIDNRKYLEEPNLCKIIRQYYQDRKISPHINLFLKSNYSEKEKIIRYTNIARQALNKLSIYNSIINAIKKNDEYEIIYLFDLIYLSKFDDDNKNILTKILYKCIDNKKIKYLDFFLKFYMKKLKYNIDKEIFKDCIKKATYQNNIEILKFLLNFYQKNCLLEENEIFLNYGNRNLFQEALLHTRTLNIALFLFENDYIDPLETDNQDYNSFYYAAKKIAQKNYPQIFLKMMKKCKYDENINSHSINDNKEKKPISFIIDACNTENNKVYYKILDLLFKKCNVEPNSNSKLNKSLIHQGIDNNDLNFVKTLINKYNIDLSNESHGLTSINYAAKKKRKEIVKYLRNIKISNNDLNSNLIQEEKEEISNIKNNNEYVIEIDDEEKYDSDSNNYNDNLMVRNSNGNTCYIYDHDLIINDFNLITGDFEKINLNEFINDNETFLNYFILHSNNKYLYGLLKIIFKSSPSNLDINKKCRNGNGILHNLVQMNEKKLYKLCKIILKENKKSEIFKRINLYDINNQNNTAMDIAIRLKNITAIEFLCTIGYDPSYNNIHTGTAIHKIIEEANYLRTSPILIWYSLFLFPPREFDSKSMYILLYFLEGCKAYKSLNEIDSSFKKPKHLLKEKIDNALFITRKRRLKKLQEYISTEKHKSKFKKLFWMKRYRKAKFPLAKYNELSCFKKILDKFFNLEKMHYKHGTICTLLILFNILGVLSLNYNTALGLGLILFPYLFILGDLIFSSCINMSLFYCT